MAEYQHGSMDTREQEKTFSGFLKLGKIGFGLAILAIVIAALANA